MKKLFCFIALFLMVSLSVKSQETLIIGTVLDKNNEPIPGVNIAIKEKGIYEITDYEGEFIIKATQGDTLSIMYIGYVTKKFIVGNMPYPFTIILEEPPPLLYIPELKVIDDRIHNLYFGAAFKSTSVLGYKYSFANHINDRLKEFNSFFPQFINQRINIGIETVFFNKKMELINPYLQFDYFIPKLDIGNKKIRLDVEPFINAGYAYSFSHKAFKPKFDFGSKILEIKLPRNFTLELFGNYSIMYGRENAFFFGINLGDHTTHYRVYH